MILIPHFRSSTDSQRSNNNVEQAAEYGKSIRRSICDGRPWRSGSQEVTTVPSPFICGTPDHPSSPGFARIMNVCGVESGACGARARWLARPPAFGTSLLLDLLRSSTTHLLAHNATPPQRLDTPSFSPLVVLRADTALPSTSHFNFTSHLCTSHFSTTPHCVTHTMASMHRTSSLPAITDYIGRLKVFSGRADKDEVCCSLGLPFLC